MPRLALKLDRSRNPAVRYRIWLLGLIAAALLPLSTGATRLLPVSF